MTPRAPLLLLLLATSCGGGQDSAATLPEGEYIITGSDDDRMVGGVLTLSEEEMTIEFTDAKGTTYLVTYTAGDRAR